MRDRYRQVAKERPIAVLADELESALEQDIVRVLPAAAVLVLAQVHPTVVECQPERVEEVCMHLVQVAQKVVKALSQGMPRAVREAETPLAIAPCRVARRLQDLS